MSHLSPANSIQPTTCAQAHSLALPRRRRALAALATFALSALAAVPAASQAQEPAHRPAVGAASRVPVLPCCRCLGEVTRLDLHTGAAAWVVSTGNGNQPTHLMPGPPNNGWTAALGPQAQWISPVPMGIGGTPGIVPSGGYTLQTSFMVPRCKIGAMLRISGAFAADNSATLWLDNVQIAATQNGNGGNMGFANPAPVNWSGPVPVPGLHTLRIVVNNQSGPSGAVARLTLSRLCEKDTGKVGDTVYDQKD